MGGSVGCLAISNMLLTNLSLRVIDLSNNDIQDKDVALFSQSLSRNKLVPLEVLRLSFNKLTCAGVESLMNAIWGSTTLRELRLDNNRINDRGAQLVAVVLTSVKLEIIDFGFNLITTVGIKALMKSLAENDSLQSLTLSGNPLDTTASKAVSYALAYNSSLVSLYVDHCSIGYAAQRHVTAGIASNSHSALRIVTGFRIGAIAVTLGLPSALENWTNEQVLGFFRFMWDRNQRDIHLSDNFEKTNGSNIELPRRSIFSRTAKVQGSKSADDVIATTSTTIGTQFRPRSRVGPSDPATVVSAAKSAYESIEDFGGEILISKLFRCNISNLSPITPSNSILLEKTPTGVIQAPPIDYVSASLTNGTICEPYPISNSSSIIQSRSNKHNLNWLALHAQKLHEIAQEPFDNADLWKLHQYFFSPVEAKGSDEEDNNLQTSMETDSVKGSSSSPKPWTNSASPDENQLSQGTNTQKKIHNLENSLSTPWTASPVLERKSSYRLLQDIDAPVDVNAPVDVEKQVFRMTNGGRRRNVSVLHENCSSPASTQPASKRLKKARIAYFPRIREKLEALRRKLDEHQALVLMRHLKYIESNLFKGQNPYSDNNIAIDSPNVITSDAEIILLDLI